MKKQRPAEKLNRRAFLRLGGLACASAAAGPILSACNDAGAYPALIRETWENPLLKEKDMTDSIPEMIQAAALAPSGHNTQPWKFKRTEARIEILPDFKRRLPVVDPQDRELYISLGCALENLLVAARAAGYQPAELTYPGGEETAIRLSLTGDGEAKEEPLFGAIQVRQCTRSLYDGTPIPAGDWKTLQDLPGEEGVSLRGYRDPAEQETWIDLVRKGNLIQYGEESFREELISWIRFNEAEALKTRDGLFSRCTGNPAAPRWLGSLFLRLSSPASIADTDEKNMRSSSAFALISSRSDTPADWVRAGQVCQRLALTASLRNIRMAFLNQPAEVPEVRRLVQEKFSLGIEFPQLFIRLGYAPPATRSLRRPVGELLI